MLSVNSIGNVNFVTKPAFKAEPEKEVKEKNTLKFQPYDINSSESLACYNKAFMTKPEPCVLKPLEPEAVPNIDEIEGEKIYNSEGKLHSIVQENGDTKKVYLPDEKDENFIASIITIEKKTGNKIKRQDMNKDDNSVCMNEYSNGEKVKSSVYTDGKLDFTSNTLRKPSGEIVIEEYNDFNKTFTIAREKENHAQNAIFNKDKQMVEFRDFKKVKGQNIDTVVSFYNGGMYKLEKHIEQVLPNSLGRENFVNNPELKPTEKFEVPVDVKGHDGEKTYYSNGAIETNSFELNGDKVIAKFNPDGELTEYSTGNKNVNFYEKGQEIKEKLDDERTKSTYITKDEYCSVTIESKDYFETLDYNLKTKRPTSYTNGTIREDGSYDHEKTLYFDKKGMLEGAY